MTKNIDLTTVGGRLKSKRVAAGLTQEELAELVLVRANYISGYESNRVNIPLNMLQALAKALNTSVSFLADGIESELTEEEAELLAIFNQLRTPELKKAALAQMKCLASI